MWAWMGVRVPKRKHAIRDMIPHCLWWVLRGERNSRYFEQREQSMVHFKYIFSSLMFLWQNEVFHGSSIAFIDFLLEFTV